MKISRLMIVAMCFRIALLILERGLGMGFDYHVDSIYYIDYIDQLRDKELDVIFLDFNLINHLYPVICYIIYIIFGEIINLSIIMIGFNLLISLFTIFLIERLYIDQDSNKKIIWPAMFLGVSPYFAHLAIHPLKDVFTIFLGVGLLYTLIYNRWLLLALVAVCLILTRFNFGILVVIFLFFWRILNLTNYVFLRNNQNLILLLVIIFFYIINHDLLLERLFVEFDGRDFYPNGFALIPDFLWLRFFLGWALNLLIPFPFLPSNLAEMGYFFHWLLFIGILSCLILKKFLYREKFKIANYGLLICIFFFFGFILTTTPMAGPLVRYRLFAEVLLLIVMTLDLSFVKKIKNDNINQNTI